MEWQKDKEVYLLVNNNEILIKVFMDLNNKAMFEINNKLYQFKHKGFFNPVYFVTCEGQEILHLKNSLWGGKGYVEFSDTAHFSLKISSGSDFKLQFFDGVQEILTYGYKIEKKKSKMTFAVGEAIIDADKLLILSAVGLITFTPYIAENNGGEELLTILSA